MGDRTLTESLSPTLDGVVVALCADYERRESMINSSTLPARIEVEYRYLNAKIRIAVEEIVGEECAITLIEEIGYKIGYAKTELDFMSEKSYKTKKLSAKVNIAKKLHFIK